MPLTHRLSDLSSRQNAVQGLLKQIVAPAQSHWFKQVGPGNLNPYHVPRKVMQLEHEPSMRMAAPVNSIKPSKTLKYHMAARHCGDR